MGGDLDVDHHQLVAAPAAAQVRHALAAHAQDFAGLRASRDLQSCRAIHRGHFDFRAQRRLGNVDVQVEQDIVLAALEELVVL